MMKVIKRVKDVVSLVIWFPLFLVMFIINELLGCSKRLTIYEKAWIKEVQFEQSWLVGWEELFKGLGIEVKKDVMSVSCVIGNQDYEISDLYRCYEERKKRFIEAVSDKDFNKASKLLSECYAILDSIKKKVISGEIK